jgi:type I restriction enzyme S subunit
LYGGNYPFVQTGDVRKAEYYLTEYSQTYNDKGLAQSKLWNEGTLCITIAANIAETAVLGIKACFPDSIIGFIPDEKKADVRFIKYCLETYKIQMQSISQGATQDNLSLEKLRSINFSIPELKIQQDIAEVLYSYDKLIENNTKRISILEQMAEQFYKEWFVRMRFPGYEKTKFVKGIAEGWEVKKISDVLQTASGGTPSRKQDRNYLNGKIEWLKTGELKTTYTTESEEKITQEGLNDSSAKVFPKGTVVIAMYCAMPYISILSEDAATNQACCAFLKKGKIDFGTYYTFHLIKNAQNHLIQFAHGAAQQNLSQDLIKNYKLLVADSFIINSFNRVVEPIYQEILNLEQQNINLKKTRDLLLPRLISGKLQIKTETEELIQERHT